MADITIKTNNVPRALICFADLTEKEREDFGYLNEGDHFSDRFFRYKGNVYDTNEFGRVRVEGTYRGLAPMDMHVDKDDPLAKWDAYQSDSYFSGVAFKWAREDGIIDYDRVVVGMLFS